MRNLYIESIRIYNGRVYNIKYHNFRCNETRKEKYGSLDQLHLRKYIDIPNEYHSGLVKCRILYNDAVQKVEFSHYRPIPIRSLKLVNIGDFQYSYKHMDRSMIEKMYEKRGAADDILMVRNNLITDTQYANIALYQNGKWFTPKTPLLPGTRRHQLIEKKILFPKNISISELPNYSKISLFNALIPLGDITLDASNSIFK